MPYTHSEINRVGGIIRHEKMDDEYFGAISILNKWREEHGPILDYFYDKCVRFARKTDSDIIVAQRLKRLPTIIDKLNRIDGMALSRMQDIAGVRIIVRDMKQLNETVNKIKRWKNRVRLKDYICNPKTSGYRGVHYIFNVKGYFVEVQVRTQLQHLWATSVETVDIFRGSEMKTRGDLTYWNDFFLLVSNSFALIEDSVALSDYSSLGLLDSISSMSAIINRYDILKSLETMAFTNVISKDTRFKKAYYILMDLDFAEKKCLVICIKEKDFDSAMEQYAEFESDKTRKHSTVFVAVNDFNRLKDAYPNYFVDLEKFSSIIKFMLDKTGNEVKI